MPLAQLPQRFEHLGSSKNQTETIWESDKFLMQTLCWFLYSIYTDLSNNSMAMEHTCENKICLVRKLKSGTSRVRFDLLVFFSKTILHFEQENEWLFQF